MQNLKAQCIAKIEAAYEAAERHFEIKIPRIPVIFSDKLTSTAGNVSFMRNTRGSIKMKLSVPIMRDNPEEFIKDTPGHEAAHHIVHCVYGTETQAHGSEWKRVMRLIGQEPKRTHRMTVVKKTQDRIAATCGCQTHMITKQRVTKMRRGMTYNCRKCRQPLTLGTQVDVLSGAIAASKAAQKPAAPRTAPKVKGALSNAARARVLITENPTATEAQLIELLRNSDIPVKPNMLKVVIQVNIKKVRNL